MCFSANVSFGAGVVLTVIGIASVKKAEHPTQILFASIPLFFAAQQITEGFLWLALPNPDYLLRQKILTYVFLFFAQVLWPLWVPIAFLLLEKQSMRRKIQKAWVGLGILTSAYLVYCLITFPVRAEIIGFHIAYIKEYPINLIGFSGVLYILSTIFPPFFSHVKRMWMLGLAILISFLFTVVFFEYFVMSVWCFFASIISISIYLLMPAVNDSHRQHLGSRPA